MGHNLHFIVTLATSAEEAVSDVESELSDWGNDNNWRSPQFAFSEEGELKIIGCDYCSRPKTGKAARKYANDLIRGILKAEGSFDVETCGLMKACTECRLERHEMYQLAAKINTVADCMMVSHPDKFDVFKDSFRPYDYEQCGCTHIMEDCGDVKPKGLKKWGVAMAVHS